MSDQDPTGFEGITSDPDVRELLEARLKEISYERGIVIGAIVSYLREDDSELMSQAVSIMLERLLGGPPVWTEDVRTRLVYRWLAIKMRELEKEVSEKKG